MEGIQALMFRKYKNLVINLMRKGMSPTEIAIAVSLGNFIGILPFLGLHTVIALGAAYILRLNIAVVFLGTQISNPFSFPFILFISAQIGNLVINGSLLTLRFTGDVEIVREYIIPTLVGSLLLGLVVAIASYPVTLRLARRFRT
ncbi:MAG: DUF2062 domain-containing protein [Nitrospirota bacterium]